VNVEVIESAAMASARLSAVTAAMMINTVF
jgi:hypothetical protein